MFYSCFIFNDTFGTHCSNRRYRFDKAYPMLALMRKNNIRHFIMQGKFKAKFG